MSLIFYYLTEDPENLKERNEVAYLSSIGRVVVVTRSGSSKRHYEGNHIKSLHLPGQSRAVVAAYSLWTKICYLLCRPLNSLTNIGFPVRNVYTGNALVRWLINRLWPAKYSKTINRLLPTYESLYFAPFKFVRLFVRDKHRPSKRFQRIIVHDSLILRLTRFTPFILSARREGLFTLANVRSWDNPFYAQFTDSADGYLTWSPSMWLDVQRFHQLKTTAHHSWGPRPFYNFACAVQRSHCKPNIAPGTIVIGYAAAFCDTLMAAHEVEVVAGLAQRLHDSGVDARILFRPYPIVPMSSYEPLRRYRNIEIVDIEGPPADRYGDGREMIRFGSDEERIQYLSRCHCFLSMATSFTFEAALFGLPVFQYFVPQGQRHTEHEAKFFERLDISDHILNYFLPYLPVANDCARLIQLITALMRDPAFRSPPLKLMEVMGFPSGQATWDDGSEQFLENMQLG
jgi:hypothetical protein